LDQPFIKVEKVGDKHRKIHMGNPFLFDCYWFGSTFACEARERLIFGSTFVKVDKVGLAQPL